MRIYNGLHKGTALLIRAVLNAAEEGQAPYVTCRCASDARVSAETAASTGGSWQWRGEFRYCLTGTPGPDYRAALVEIAAGVQS